MKVAMSIQFTFSLKINLQKYVFQQIVTTFLANNVYFLNPS